MSTIIQLVLFNKSFRLEAPVVIQEAQEAIELIEIAIDTLLPPAQRKVARKGLDHVIRILPNNARLDFALQIRKDLEEIIRAKEKETASKLAGKIFSLGNLFTNVAARRLIHKLVAKFPLYEEVLSYAKKLYILATGEELSRKEILSSDEVRRLLRAPDKKLNDNVTRLVDHLINTLLDVLMDTYYKYSGDNDNLWKAMNETAFNILDILDIKYSSLNRADKIMFILLLISKLEKEAEKRTEAIVMSLFAINK